MSSRSNRSSKTETPASAEATSPADDTQTEVSTTEPTSSAVNEDQARFSALIANAASEVKSAQASDQHTTAPTSFVPPVASVGRIVHYHSKKGDGIVSPAIVLRTRQSTNPEVIDRWGDNPDGTLSGVSRPDELVAELPDDETVDLLVHGLGGDYREYAVPFAFPTPAVEEAAPGTWSWPPRA